MELVSKFPRSAASPSTTTVNFSPSITSHPDRPCQLAQPPQTRQPPLLPNGERAGYLTPVPSMSQRTAQFQLFQRHRGWVGNIPLHCDRWRGSVCLDGENFSLLNLGQLPTELTGQGTIRNPPALLQFARVLLQLLRRFFERLGSSLVHPQKCCWLL